MTNPFPEYRTMFMARFFMIGLAILLSHASFADVLTQIRKDTPKPKYGEPVPEKVSGRVTSDKKGVSGVSVSDGYRVVKTDGDGRFLLKPDPRSVFIYLTKPSGYSVVGDWYKAVDSNVDFVLKPVKENDYFFIHVTDTHVSNNKMSQEGLSQFVSEANTLSPDIRFVLNSGDLVNLSKSLENDPATGHSWMAAYSGIMNNLEMPYYNVAGDHSDSSYRLDEFPRGDTRCGKPLFWEYLGPNLFSFEYGNIHFVSVDYANHLGKRQLNEKEYPTLQLQPDQVKWMTRDMNARRKGTFVITTSEWDLVEHCEDFEKIAKANDIRLQLVGDSHTVSYNDEQVPYRIGGALSGCWWNKNTDLCPDLNQRGYFIYHVRGEKIDQFYKGLGRRVEINSHREGDFWKGKIRVQAHIVQPSADEQLEYSLNGKDWTGMEKTGEPFYRRSFEAEIDSGILRDGFVKLQVRSTDTKETSSVKVVSANGNQSQISSPDGVLKFSVGKWRNAKKAPSGKVEVLFNDQVIGELKADKAGDYSFPVASSLLQKANLLSFHFAGGGDEMGISQLTLKCGDATYRDPVDEAIREVKSKHWGPDSVDWGAYIVGNGRLGENSFTFKRNAFLFVLK
jgi:hypothetical protein